MDWSVVIPYIPWAAGVLAVIGFSIKARSVTKTAGAAELIALETKEAVGTFMTAISPDSPGGKQITTGEFVEIAREAGEAVKAFMGSTGDESK